MEYTTYKPKDLLADKVKYFWSLESSGDSHSRERIFPDGCIELIFHYGDHFKKFHIENYTEIQPKSFIHGQITKFIEIQASGKIGMLCARFHPAGLRHFIDFEVSNITDKTMTVQEIWPDEGEILEQKIGAANTNEARIIILEEFLLSKLKLSKINDSIDECVNYIFENNGIVQIEKLTQKLHLSKRQLERNFLSGVGLNLKMFSRIIRFNFALQLIENKDFEGFTSVAHEGGFYDQAHFIKDFKEITGLNPKQYFSENLEMVKFFNLE